MKKIVIIAVGFVLSACAQKPEAIAPAYASPMTYSSMNCDQMRSEAVRLDNALVRASAQQNEARQADTVGVIFLGLPVSSLSGGSVADQIAHLKGQKETLEQSQIAQNCIRLADLPVDSAGRFHGRLWCPKSSAAPTCPFCTRSGFGTIGIT